MPPWRARTLQTTGETRRRRKAEKAMPANKEDGTNPEGHIWRIAPTRRDFVGFLGWGAVLTSIGIGTLAWVRLMYPRVLFEPPSQFKLGRPSEYAPRSCSEQVDPRLPILARSLPTIVSSRSARSART